MLAEEIHPALGAATAALTVIAAALTVACSRYGHCPLRRLLRESGVAGIG
jgi:hypothetical protein